jgi:hypothetical protein
VMIYLSVRRGIRAPIAERFNDAEAPL